VDFELKNQVRELSRPTASLLNGTEVRIEFRHGLPFLMETVDVISLLDVRGDGLRDLFEAGAFGSDDIAHLDPHVCQARGARAPAIRAGGLCPIRTFSH
jgi:hypothetical protein